MHSTVTRRELLRYLGLGSLGLVVAACQPQIVKETVIVEKPVEKVVEKKVVETQVVEKKVVETKVVEKVITQAAAPAEKGVALVRCSVWGDTGDRSSAGAIQDAFNEQHKDIKVIGEQYVGGYYEKIIANFAGGNSADVLYVQPWTWQAYADQGVLVAIDDLIQRDTWTKPWVSDLPIYTNYCKWQGKTFETPTDAGADPIYYNKDLFDKRGVPYPKDDWKLDDLKATIEKMTFEEGGVKYYGWALANNWNGIWGRFQNLWRTNGILEFDQIVEPKKVFWDDERIAQACQFFVTDVVKNGWCPSPSAIAGGGISIASGRVAMCIEGPWTLPSMYGALAFNKGGINFDVVMQPTGTTGYVDAETSLSGLVISNQTKNRDACWEYIKHVTTEPSQQVIANFGRMCNTPEFQTKLWKPTVQKTYNFQNADAFIKTQNDPKARGFMVGGEGGDMNAFYNAGAWPAWDELIAGERSAKEVLADFNKLQQKWLDDYWAKKK
jgi:multiple sugar transport system substrate-binding protein